MKAYRELTRAERQTEYAAVRAAYDNQKAQGLKLNMARGKPGRDQLDLVTPMLSLVTRPEDFGADGIEERNYGEVAGLPEAKALFAEILGCKSEQVFVGGNASLQLMYDAISKAFTHGLLHSEQPWSKLGEVKWLCPVPGYDRHFMVTQSFGVKLINVPMTADGPDMDVVEELVKDPAVKGMWNVPKYSNPEGVAYSEETVRRLAALKPAAPDFMLMWDNAYCIHHLSDHPDHLLNLMDELRKTGHEDMMITFASTSKISFPGGGVAAMACSKANLDFIKKQISVQTIGYDKINQMRHVMFYKDLDGLQAHMEKHRAILEPKFEKVVTMLEERLGGLDVASWNKPNGGYFVSVDVMEGCAKRVVSLCKEAGVVLTGAGATYPYGKDPKDTNIRLAPTMPPVSELEQAMALFCLCVQIAALEKLTEN